MGEVVLHWDTAIDIAKNQNDVTYDEWCELYVNRREPEREQIDKACDAAHSILVRNRVIESSVRFDKTIRFKDTL